MKKFIPLLILGLFAAYSSSAHVVVSPKSATVAVRHVFTLSVSSERSISTVGLRLILPEGIKSVTPNVKPGWKIAIKTQVTGKKITDEHGVEMDELIPVEIEWTGGVIPPGQRDEFFFATQVPSDPTALVWKAYQKYQDGSVVAWDQAPGSNIKTPYSVTQVIDDLSVTATKKSWWEANQVSVTLGISLLALITSLGILLKKDNEKPTS